MRSCVRTAKTSACPMGRWAIRRWDTSISVRAGVVYQDLVKINRACRDDSILKNPEIVKAFEYAKSNGVSVHLMGLVSDGGVHSSLDHLLKLTDIADKYGIERTYVHCFMDGRDTDPYSGKGFIERLEKHMRERSTGVVASIVGRYYAMDATSVGSVCMPCCGISSCVSTMVSSLARSFR